MVVKGLKPAALLNAIYYESISALHVFRMAHERILHLEHEIRVAHRLHEANIQSLTADLNAAFIDADKKKERVVDLEEQLDVQGNELKITQDHLVRI